MTEHEKEVWRLWDVYIVARNIHWVAARSDARDDLPHLEAIRDKAHAAYRTARHGTPAEQVAAAFVAPLQEIAKRFPDLSFRAVGRRIFGRKK
jgi:hypothetical protein